MKILNLTQHPATPEQVAEGVFEPKDKEKVKNLLTFEKIEDCSEKWTRAKILAELAKEEFASNNGIGYAMIGGAPFFMRALENSLMKAGVIPVYAFSQRISVETVGTDGKVTKASVFKHVGFV